RNVALERARIGDSTRAEVAVTAEAVVLAEELRATRGLLLAFGQDLARRCTEIGDEIVDLTRRDESPICGHAECGALHARDVVGIVAPALRRAVEDVLSEIVGRLHVHHLGLLGERGHLAFLAPRILGAAAAVGAVAGEAAELARETAPARRRR